MRWDYDWNRYDCPPLLLFFALIFFLSDGKGDVKELHASTQEASISSVGSYKALTGQRIIIDVSSSFIDHTASDK